jgi:PAS domain S-box-containing protein
MTTPSLRRVVAAFGVILAMLGLIGLVFFMAANRTAADLQWLGVNRLGLIQLVMDAQGRLGSSGRLTVSIFLLEDEQELQEALARQENISRRISERIRQIDALLTAPEERSLYSEVLQRRDAYLTAYSQAVRLYRDPNTRSEARALMESEALPLLTAYHEAWRRLLEFEGDEMDRFAASAVERSRKCKRSTLFLLLTTGSLAIVVAVLTIRRQRIEELKRREMARALEESQAALEAKIRERTTQVERTKAELRRTNHDLVAVLDVNERTSQDLRAKEDRLRKLVLAVEQAAECIVITDTRGRIEFVNPAFEDRTGYSAAEVLHRSPRVLKSGWQDADFYKGLWTTIREGRVWTGRMVNRRKDGTLFHEDATISPVRENGRVIGYVAVKRDVTREVILEHQLLQAQKLEAIGRLAAGIAHEINTPTQFVADNTHFLKDGFADILPLLTSVEARPEIDLSFLMTEIPKAIDQSLEGLERISKIVGAMKDFSHPGTEELKPSDLNRALDSTITVSRGEWKHVAEVTTEFCFELPPVPMVVNEINQVFLVLIVNAAQAIEEAAAADPGRKGVIAIRTSHDGTYAEVRISDNGPGIPKSVQSRVFEPFFTTKPLGKGTGQGLSLARSIVVDRHHGRLDFETEEGAGTTFIVRLPLVAPPSQGGGST